MVDFFSFRSSILKATACNLNISYLHKNGKNNKKLAQYRLRKSDPQNLLHSSSSFRPQNTLFPILCSQCLRFRHDFDFIKRRPTFLHMFQFFLNCVNLPPVPLAIEKKKKSLKEKKEWENEEIQLTAEFIRVMLV